MTQFKIVLYVLSIKFTYFRILFCTVEQSRFVDNLLESKMTKQNIPIGEMQTAKERPEAF